MWFRDLWQFFEEDNGTFDAVRRQVAGLDKEATTTGSNAGLSDGEEENNQTTETDSANRQLEPTSSKLAIAESAMTGDLPGNRRHHEHHGFLSVITSCCRCFAGLCALCYVFCPPVPSCVVRKIAFKPPKRGQSYKLVVTTKSGQRKFVSTARTAAHYPKVDILATIFDTTPSGTHINIQPLYAESFIVHSKSGNHIVCGIFRTTHNNHDSQTMFSNKVAIFAQPNSSDIGGFMQPYLPSSFPNLAVSIGVDLYVFDYSGYGRSGGTPGEKNMYNDIASVYEAVRKRVGTNTEIVLIGYSIGTAAVVDLASQNPPQMVGVVLIAPFASGLRLFGGNPRVEQTSVLDCLESYDKIHKVDVPVLICTGTRDQVTPMSHGQVLYERCKHKIDPLIIDGATHVTILNGRHFQVQLAIRFFIATSQKPSLSPVNEILRDAKQVEAPTTSPETGTS